MKDLIQALRIFQKYQDVTYPTNCEHDVMYIMKITQDEVSDTDKAELETLGFHWDEEVGCWATFKYGSA